MLLVILTGTALLLATIAVHGVAVLWLYYIGIRPLSHAENLSPLARLGWCYVFVVGFVIAHLIEIVIWALAYKLTGELKDFEEALYFSAITFATIGYGDVTLERKWRLASALEGVNGILLFGWTTAFLFKVSAVLWFGQTTPAEPESLQNGD
ncbi:ion transporter [Rhizobium sp. Root73]|uniref:potassium channel family protein n=1 Tax=unclassified Rhizobium TaxID=2613769 RepID=UPI00072B1BCE|nr:MULTISPECIES: potassium channel family protein [unclassified Rhizobium]KQY13109.1 ion transporter [Rhizobium sp. Root1334]KRC12568.1 ion transporter [Rhizobium sp. Root73]